MTNVPEAVTNEAGFDWLINDFVERVPGVAHGVTVSADGLLLTGSRGLPDERAEQLAAIACGLVSLTEGAARCFEAGNVNETIVEMDGGSMVMMSISDGSSIAVLAEPNCDLGQVAYEMARLVDRVGQVLTPELRSLLRGEGNGFKPKAEL